MPRFTVTIYELSSDNSHNVTGNSDTEIMRLAEENVRRLLSAGTRITIRTEAQFDTVENGMALERIDDHLNGIIAQSENRLSDGQLRLLQNLVSRGTPELGEVCRQVDCSTAEAEALEDRGLVMIETEGEDVRTTIFITESGKRAAQ